MQTRDIYPNFGKLVKNRVSYIDRLHCWCDTNRRVLDAKAKRELKGAKIKYREETRPQSVFHRDWHSHLKFLQIEQEDLGIIERIIFRIGCDYQISYTELATDFVTKTQADAAEVHQLIEQSLIYCPKNEYFYENNYRNDGNLGTAYYAKKRPSNQNSTNKKFVKLPVLYSDRRKLLPNPCAHIEIRLGNTRMCKEEGIRIVRNLQDIDIAQYHASHFNFAKKPTQSQVGKLIADMQGKSITTERGYRSCCDSFFIKNTGINYKNVPIQQVLYLLPELQNESGIFDLEFNDRMKKALFGNAE